jgi:hypothetical protein
MGFYMTEIVTYPFTETRCEHTHKKKAMVSGTMLASDLMVCTYHHTNKTH